MSRARQQNVFDTLRVLAAASVLYWHSFALTGHAQPVIPLLSRAGGNYGSLAVGAFFAMSGYLISSSWVRRPQPGVFVRSRVLRIFPALIVCVALTALVLGPLVTRSGHYWTTSTADYITHNSTLYRQRFVLPGVFEHNPYPQAVNGSLWTLPFEAIAYAVVLVWGLLGGLRSVRLTVLFAVVWCAAYATVVDPGSHVLPLFVLKAFAHLELDPHLLLTVGSFFVCGMVCAVLGDRFFEYRRVIAVSAAVTIVCASVASFPLGLNIGAALLVVCAGSCASSISRRIRRWGDPSYGAYIYAFPIQQVLADAGLRSQAAMFVVGTILSLAAGYLSWHLLESRALRLAHRVRRAEAVTV